MSTVAPERVAVIAVHGVGDQGPNETAREVARLLQRANEGAYSAFREDVIDLAVVTPAPPAGAPRGARGDTPWFVRSPHVRQLAAHGAEATDDVDFTSSAIDAAQPEGRTARYASIRLRGARRDPDTAVDVYELYWADLSRLSGVLAQVLGKFYQLLFHLATLGRKTVELAWLRERHSRRALGAVTPLQSVIDVLIAGVLPVLNLCFAAVVLPVLLLRASDTVRLVACALIVAALVGAVVYEALFRGTERPLKAWSALPPLLAGAASGGAAAVAIDASSRAPFALYVLALVVLLAAVAWLAKRLADRRAGGGVGDRRLLAPPALTAIVGIPLGAALSWWGWSRHAATGDDAVRVAQAIAFAADGMFYLLEVAFRLLLIAGVLLAVGYLWVRVAVRRREGGAATTRALWTGQMGFFLPTVLFFIVTVILWKSLLQMIAHSIPKGTSYSPWLPEFLPRGLLAVFPDLATRTKFAQPDLASYVETLSTAASGSLFNLLAYLVAAAIVLLVLGLLPSIVAETSPPAGSSRAKSHRLGVWLDDGFAAAKLAGWLVLVALVVVLPVSGSPWAVGLFKQCGLGALTGDSVAAWVGGLIAGSVAILAAFRRNIFGGAQKGLDIALDIDNWLQERPRRRNPRGLILLRYLALLREVERGAYDRILIVSHSQGTVVTADLLRYLNAGDGANRQKHGLGALGRVPIRLLTVGSPLRQLYSLRFPHLYGWARHHDEAQPGLRRPDPAKLGVVVWVNGYRSGDYVGRYLWAADSAPDRYDPVAVDTTLAGLKRVAASGTSRFEFCLGEGAHTHYLDETATPVGRIVDALVLER